MAAPIDLPKHHVREELCTTRATYREGRKQKAVKVYTVNLESKYLLVQGVPAMGATHELIKLFALHGAIEEYRILDEYPTADQFTDVFLIKYKRIQSARHAKHRLDDWSFLGGVLHVCYAPEFETVDDTRDKLQDRRKTVAAKIRQHGNIQSQTGNRIAKKTDTDLGASSKSEDVASQDRVRCEGQSSSSASNQETGYKEFKPIETKMNYHQHGQRETIGTAQPSTDRNLYQNQNFQEEYNLNLPLPPGRGHINLPHFSHGGKYEYARVPSAHASLPVNFDGRLNSEHYDNDNRSHTSQSNQNHSNNEQQNYKTMEGKELKSNLKGNNCLGFQNSQKINTPDKKSETNDSVNEKPTEHKVIIRDYKKVGSAPKFVPRQTMNLLKKKEESVNNKKTTERNSEKDKLLNERLRQNALILNPKPQGPLSVDGDEPKLSSKEDNSMQETVKNIRKRMNKFSSTLESPTEKKIKPS